MATKEYNVFLDSIDKARKFNIEDIKPDGTAHIAMEDNGKRVFDVDTRVNTLISYQKIHGGNNQRFRLTRVKPREYLIGILGKCLTYEADNKFIAAPCSSSLNEKQRFIVVEEDEINTEPALDVLEEEGPEEDSADLLETVQKASGARVGRIKKYRRQYESRTPHLLKSRRRIFRSGENIF